MTALQAVWPYAAMLIAFNALGDGLGYLLAMRGRYAYAAAAPIANALLGAAILLAWPGGGAVALAVSTAAGLALQVALCAMALQRAGFAFNGPLPAWDEARRDWHELLRLGAWILLSMVFSSLRLTVPNVLMTSFGEGAVASFSYAKKFNLMTVQLLAMAASPVILARLSEYVAGQKVQAIARVLARSGLVATAIGVSASLFVWAAGSALLAVLFGGRFDAAAADRVAGHWLWLTLGLAPAIWGNVYAKLWQALKWSMWLTGLAGMGFVVFMAFVGLLWIPLAEWAVPAALSCSEFAVLLGFRWRERRWISAVPSHV